MILPVSFRSFLGVVYLYWLDRRTPSLHLHYKDFITTTSLSAFVQRISTFTLRFPVLEFFLFHRYDNFKRSTSKACVKFMSPVCRTPSNQYLSGSRWILILDLRPASSFDVLYELSTLSYGDYLVVHLLNTHLMQSYRTFSSNVHHSWWFNQCSLGWFEPAPACRFEGPFFPHLQKQHCS